MVAGCRATAPTAHATAAARHAAVGRGVAFLWAYLSADWPRLPLLLGEQCVALFYDVWLSLSRSGGDDE